jgi:hypothetical protein
MFYPYPLITPILQSPYFELYKGNQKDRTVVKCESLLPWSSSGRSLAEKSPSESSIFVMNADRKSSRLGADEQEAMKKKKRSAKRGRILKTFQKPEINELALFVTIAINWAGNVCIRGFRGGEF